MALLGMRGLVRGPRPKPNHPTPTELRQRYRHDEGACSIDDSTPVAWFPVHGPGREGSGATGQVLCSEMGNVLPLEDATKSACPLQASLL